MISTGNSLQHSAATAVSDRLGAMDMSSWFIVRVEGPPLRSAATLLFDVSKVEDMSVQFITRKGDTQPYSRGTAVIDRLGGLGIFAIFSSRVRATRSLSLAGLLTYRCQS